MPRAPTKTSLAAVFSGVMDRLDLVRFAAKREPDIEAIYALRRGVAEASTSLTTVGAPVPSAVPPIGFDIGSRVVGLAETWLCILRKHLRGTLEMISAAAGGTQILLRVPRGGR